MMRWNRQVVIFARAPRFGVGKRRLAADVGRGVAHRFYRWNLARQIAELGCGPWRLAVAVADRHEVDAPAFAHRSRIWQGLGDLGQRMVRVLRCGYARPAGPVVIVGSDIPDLCSRQVAEAFEALRTRDIVFGPSADGGFYLVGVSGRRPVPRGFMDGVRWSGPHAMRDTCATLPAHWRVAFLGSLDDIDDGADYHAWKARTR